MARSQWNGSARATRAADEDYGVLRRSFFVVSRRCLAPGRAAFAAPAAVPGTVLSHGAQGSGFRVLGSGPQPRAHSPEQWRER